MFELDSATVLKIVQAGIVYPKTTSLRTIENSNKITNKYGRILPYYLLADIKRVTNIFLNLEQATIVKNMLVLLAEHQDPLLLNSVDIIHLEQSGRLLLEITNRNIHTNRSAIVNINFVEQNMELAKQRKRRTILYNVAGTCSLGIIGLGVWFLYHR